MKKILLIVCILIMLPGCRGAEDCMDQALRLRSQLTGAAYGFDAKVTADYGDAVYTFSLRCSVDKQGTVTFSVTEPETIAGITGQISSGGGALTFDDVALAFDVLADGQISPVSAPWVMVNALTGGYITSAGVDGEYTRVTIRDSYEDDAMTVDIWLNTENMPVQAEILWKNRRILTIQLENFRME